MIRDDLVPASSPDAAAGMGAAEVKADKPKPNITLVLHEPQVSVREVLRALSVGFRDKLKLTYKSARYGGPEAPNVLVVRMHAAVAEETFDGVAMDEITPGEARRRAHCELMDRFEVPNGSKSIAIALHDHWTAALVARFGQHAPPSSVKRWRAEERRRRGSWHGGHASSRYKCRAEALERRVRVHHAIRVGATGLTMRQGYRGALDELAMLRADFDARHGTSLSDDKPFSYSTFRRECGRVTPSRRRRAGRR